MKILSQKISGLRGFTIYTYCEHIKGVISSQIKDSIKLDFGNVFYLTS